MILNFLIFWSWDPSHPLRVAILSNLPQELRKMVEYELENDIESWKIMFRWFCYYFDVFYKLLVACPLSHRGFFLAKRCVSGFWDMHLSGFLNFHRFVGPVGANK